MDKEKVTEELVRQNGNQAAAVMADFAGGGGSTGGGSKGVYGGIVDLFDLPCFKPFNEWPALSGDDVPITDVLADGYAPISLSLQSDVSFVLFLIVKVTGSEPSASVVDGQITFTDCEAVTLDLPGWVVDHFDYIQAIRTIVLDDISKENPLIENTDIFDKSGLPESGYLDGVNSAPLLIVHDRGSVLVATSVRMGGAE